MTPIEKFLTSKNQTNPNLELFVAFIFQKAGGPDGRSFFSEHPAWYKAADLKNSNVTIRIVAASSLPGIVSISTAEMGDDDRSAAELDDELQYLHDLEQRNVQLLPTPQAMSAELTAERNKMVKVMHAVAYILSLSQRSEA